MSSVVDLARDLSSALLGKIGIPDCIGALILGQLFPGGDEGPPSYFTEVYEEIKNIVHQELTQVEIDNVNAVINGTNDWVRTEYMIMKADPKQAGALFQELKRREEEYYTQVIAKLRLDRYRMVGFSVFLIGAGVHLALLQELAMRDDLVPDDPWSSDYAKLLLKLASEYGDYATATWSQIAKARRDPVHIVDNEPAGMNSWNVYWTDPVNGYSWGLTYSDTVGEHEKALAQVDAAMGKYLDELIAQLQSDIGEPNTVVANWADLQKRPLPLPSAAKISSRCTTTLVGRSPQGCSYEGTITWETTDAVEVYLGSAPVGPSGSQQYRWFEPEHGPGTSSGMPSTMTAVDKHGCPITTLIG
jgi:hypothetical protein